MVGYQSSLIELALFQQEERCVNHSATVMSPEKTEIDAFRARKIALITGITGQVLNS